MKLVVPNSSVISALNALNCFEHFGHLALRMNWIIKLPNLVIDEIKDKIDLLDLSKSVHFQIFEINEEFVVKLRNRFPALGDGELAVLVLVLNYKSLGINANSALAILDDKVARRVARESGIEYFGTLRLLKKMHDVGILDKSQFFEFIGKLRKSGFFFKEELVRELIE